MSMEIELKLEIDSQSAALLHDHPLLAQYADAAPVEEELESIYYDTPDFSLQRQQAALRVRRTAAGWVQTLKAGGNVQDGVHSRHEWESPVTSDRLDLPALLARMEQADPLGAQDGAQAQWRLLLATPSLGQLLVPVFTTRFRRTAWMLSLPQGDVVECALDEGEVVLADAATPLCEVELELKAGDAACLPWLAGQLGTALPMRPSNVSKAERGYRLARLQRQTEPANQQ